MLFEVRLMHLGRRSANKHGCYSVDAQECALDFVEWAYAHPKCAEYSPALLVLAANHRVIDFIRRLNRTRARELPHSTDQYLSTSSPWARQCPREDPEAAACLAESSREIEAAVLNLTFAQQDLFGRRFSEEESISDLAKSYGCTEHSVHQRLTVIRKRLRKVLRVCEIVPSESV